MPNLFKRVAPTIQAPKNWEELEQAFSGLQRYVESLNQEHQELAEKIGQLSNQKLLSISTGDVPYAASRFTADTGTWTVEDADVHYFRWTKIGQMMLLQFSFLGTVLSATTTTIYITLPEFSPLPAGRLDNVNSLSSLQRGGSFWWNADPYIGAGLITARRQFADHTLRLELLPYQTLSAATTDNGATSIEDSVFMQWPATSGLQMNGQIFVLVKD